MDEHPTDDNEHPTDDDDEHPIDDDEHPTDDDEPDRPSVNQRSFEVVVGHVSSTVKIFCRWPNAVWTFLAIAACTPRAVLGSAPLGSSFNRRAENRITGERTSSYDDGNPAHLANGDPEVSQDFFNKIQEKVRGAVRTKYQVTGNEINAPTIYKVPMELRRGNHRAYEPVSVHIGFGATWLLRDLFGNSYCDSNTRQLQEYKWWCVQQLSEKARIPEPLTRCLQILKGNERKIRASYSEDFAIPADMSDDLALTMLLDGCFILRLLLKYNRLAKREAGHGHGSGGGQVNDEGEAPHGHGSGGGQVDDDDDDDYRTQMVGRCSVWELVKRDMLLLQNQVPFFVLKDLFELLKSDPNEPDSVLVAGALRLFLHLHPQRLGSASGIASPDPSLGLIQKLLGQILNFYNFLIEFALSFWARPRVQTQVVQNLTLPLGSATIECKDVHHLLHLFYRSIDRVETTDRPHQRELLSELPQWVPCAKELEEAGVRFRRRKDAKSFMDVRFDGGVLEIPQLQLYDYSEAMFRNLIAFEQTYPDTRLHVTTYAAFMDCLLKTPVDSGILHLHGILVNQINDEQDATSFFNRICAQVHWPTDNYLVEQIRKMNKYKDSKLHKWRALLVRRYFSSPWAAMSLLAAVILLLMTVLQTIFSVYGYFKPPK